jgi:hypothetical protein
VCLPNGDSGYRYVCVSLQNKREDFLSHEHSSPVQLHVVLQNCSDVGTKWAEFKEDGPTNPLEEVEICTSILLNNGEDDLLYYNRIIAAETQNEADKYLIAPPADAKFKVPTKYSFLQDPDANIIIVYLAMANFGNFVINVSIASSKGLDGNIIIGYSALTNFRNLVFTDKRDIRVFGYLGWSCPALQCGHCS